MIGIAQHFGPRAIRSNVPGVEIRDPRDLARVPVNSLESEWPNHEDQVAGFTQKRLVHHELVIAVLVPAFHPRPVAPPAMYPWSRLPGEDEPAGIDWLKQ